MSLESEFAADLAEILNEQGRTCTIGSDSGVPCAFVTTGTLQLQLFMEQDTEAAKLVVAIADLTLVPAAGTLVTAPDGATYRIATVMEDGYGVSVLFTLTDRTGPV